MEQSSPATGRGRAKQGALTLVLIALTSGALSCMSASRATVSSAPPGSTTSRVGSQPAISSSSGSDPAQRGRALTDYLNKHGFPLVGASVPDKTHREILLYGFVATPVAKTNAEQELRRVLNDDNLTVLNHIIVRPDLLLMEEPEKEAQDLFRTDETGSDASRTSNKAYEDYRTSNQTQEYQQQVRQQQQSDWLRFLIMLLTMAPMFIP